MNQTEQLMLKVIQELSDLKASIVFKGAMILKLLLAEHTSMSVSRDTRDIDGDWISIHSCALPRTKTYFLGMDGRAMGSAAKNTGKTW